MTPVEWGPTTYLRWIAFVLACWNMRWSICGAWEIVRGRISPPSLYLSVVFGFALVCVTFWAAWLFGANPAWRFLSYLLLCGTMALAAYGNQVGSALKARQFYGLYGYLGVAVAIADLARVNPAAAEHMADQCRAETAKAMVTQHG